MRIKLFLLAAFLTLSGGILLNFGSSNLMNEFAVRSWPQVAGIVKTSSVIAAKGSKRTTWCPHWVYQYTVADQSYTSSRTAIGVYPCEQSPRLAEEKLKTHPVNAPIQVTYDPEKPNFSVIYSSDDGGFFWWFLSISGVIMIISGGYIIFKALKYSGKF